MRLPIEHEADGRAEDTEAQHGASTRETQEPLDTVAMPADETLVRRAARRLKPFRLNEPVGLVTARVLHIDGCNLLGRVTKHVVEPLGRSGGRVAIRARRAVEATQQLGVSAQRGLGGGCARRLQQSSGADAHMSAEQLGYKLERR